MLKDFKHDYPTPLIIINGTRFRTQISCAPCLQRQLISDNKSSTTLNALIGCYPNSSMIFPQKCLQGVFEINKFVNSLDCIMF